MKLYFGTRVIVLATAALLPASLAYPQQKPAAAAKLAPASESHDPAVHALLAQRQAATQNLAATEPDPTAKARAEEAKAQLADVDKQLADLGFTAA